MSPSWNELFETDAAHGIPVDRDTQSANLVIPIICLFVLRVPTW